MTRRPGRPPGASGTRAAILDAARRQFAAVGFHRATIRAIAEEASVDPALVHHYYGTKRDLFVTAIELPFDPAEVLPRLLAGDPERVGERLATLFLTTWDAAQDRSAMLSLLRSAVADEQAAAIARDFATEVVIGPVAAALADDDADLRAALAATQMVGLAMARYVVGIEPLASADAATVAHLVGPTLQRYLAGDLHAG